MTRLPSTVFCLAALLSSQMNTASDKTPIQDTKTQELIERIKRGDDAQALLEAGRTGNLAFVPYLREHAPPDAQRMKPIYLASGTLAALIPDGAHQIESQKSLSLFSSESFSFWTDYIQTHEDELKKLQPTGEGVDFSPNACKDGKPRKKH